MEFDWAIIGPMCRQSVDISLIKTCDVCARSKTPHHRPYGLLHPLLIPSRPWVSLSMNFITDLPLVGGYDTMLVIVDPFSKMAHFVPCSKTISGEQTTDLFLKNDVRLHGLPEDITSDRGSQFISTFGHDFYKHSGLLSTCPQHTILKLIDKWSASTKSSNNTFGVP